VANIPTQLADALSDRYVLERELGRGGMATVYLARDLKHKRPVALKVLRPELAASLGPERFQREIEFAARLQHPHILTVLDSGDAAGQLWFTMPYVEGESLRARLAREGQLAIEAALRIAGEAAQALQYAHEHGVIHRDVKPENLLLTTDGNTLVADFGIARALGGPGSDERLTETGLSVGTPRYMSPEQASADKMLDARTDVYSLGCVLYEMLAGEPPFTGPSPQAIIAKRLIGSVPSVRELRPTVTPALDQAVRRALARAPADRFGSMTELGRGLEAARSPDAVFAPAADTLRVPAASRGWHGLAVAASVAIVLLLGLGAAFAWRRAHGSAQAAGPTRLAVLPFENLGPGADEYFADGVTDAVRGKLAALPGLQVTASNSSGQYKHTSKTPQEVGQELGVQYLLVGKVRWDRGQSGQSRVEVSPELVQAATASTRWEQPFDAALTDVFQVQADIAGRVAQALDVALGTGERERLAEKPTANLAAYDLYLQGNEVASGVDMMPALELRRAIDLYERAVALDSGFALAWAQLSRSHSSTYNGGVPAAADAEGARAAAERALALRPDLAEGHLALGDYYNFVRQDWARASAEYEAGRRIAPNNAELLKGVGLVARSQGRWDEGLSALRQALSLDPRSMATARRLNYTLVELRRYSEALESADRALALNPRDPAFYQSKAMVFLAEGDLSKARAVIKAAQREIESTALVAFMSNYWDLFWVLDDAQQQLLLRLPAGAFADDRLVWGLALAETAALRGDTARARAYADSARLAGETQIREAPESGTLHVELGTALAYLGRRAEAVREGEQSVVLRPLSKDAYLGAYVQHQLVRIYLLVGEPDKALDQLEPLLKVPYFLSPGWLRIDPTFAPLKGNPRFERLVAGK
jgi:serine/threonine-protein kinase